MAQLPHHVDKLIRNADDTTCTPKCFAGGKAGGEGLAISQKQRRGCFPLPCVALRSLKPAELCL